MDAVAGRTIARTPKAERTRDAILTAAIELMRDEGYERATMRAIAERAGVSTRNAYYYFRSKEELVQAFYARTHDEHLAAARPRLADARGLRGRLLATMSAKLETIEPHHPFAGVLLRTTADPASPLNPFRSESRPVREEATALFESARRALFAWRMLPPRTWFRIHPAEPFVDVGEDRVLCVRVLGSWWTSPVRVVDACGREAGADRAALTWGTLPGHHVVGEERFEVALRADGSVVYRLRAFARWSKLPARLAPALARMAQRRFARDSVRALANSAHAQDVREITP